MTRRLSPGAQRALADTKRKVDEVLARRTPPTPAPVDVDYVETSEDGSPRGVVIPPTTKRKGGR